MHLNKTLKEATVEELERALELRKGINNLESQFESIKGYPLVDSAKKAETMENGDLPASRLNSNFKAIGREHRQKYLQQLYTKGIKLDHEQRTAYLTPSGNRVVLPVANHPFKPGKWFLGAPKKFFDKCNTLLILICVENGEFLDFILPLEMVEFLAPRLTEVKGDLRFNVRRTDGCYYLYIPRADKVEITRYLRRYEPLRES